MSRHPSIAARPYIASALIAVLTGCASATEASVQLQPVSLSFLTVGGEANGFAGPYVSVVDSVDLTITPASGGIQHYGKHVARRDSVVSFQLSVSRGQSDFAARVLSVTGLPLYDGAQSAAISDAPFSVSLPLTARAPILLVAPDTAKAIQTVQTSFATFRFMVVTVHNRGTDTLTWSVKDTLPQSSTSQCAGGCVRFSPSQGRLLAGRSAQLMVVRQVLVPYAPFAAPITFVITSGAMGEVPVVASPF